MAAERITGYPSYLGKYNSYSVPMAEEDYQPQKDSQSESQKNLNADVEHAPTPAAIYTPSGNADVHQIAESFAGRDRVLSDFSTGSEIETVDMRQAISAMQGDRLLQEYQYFVGSAQNAAQGNVISNTADGTVIRLS